MGSNAGMQAFHSVPETTACVSQSGRDTKDGKKKGRRRDQCPEYGEQQNAPGSQAWWSSPIIPAPGRLWLRTGKPPHRPHLREKAKACNPGEEQEQKSRKGRRLACYKPGRLLGGSGVRNPPSMHKALGSNFNTK